MEKQSDGFTKCGSCGDNVGQVHRCPDYGVSMYPFCGTPVGPEGFGQPIRCPSSMTRKRSAIVKSPGKKQQPQRNPQLLSTQHLQRLLSPSPIIAAFARANTLQKSASQSMPVCIDVSSMDSVEVMTSTAKTTVAPVAPVVSSSAQSSGFMQRPAHAQVVTSLAQRRKVLRWMVATEAQHGIKPLFSKAVDKFPAIFKSTTRRANIAKATDWWRKRARYLEDARGSTTLSWRRPHGRVRVNRKCTNGRGRRPSEWVTWLYPVLLDEFDRLRKAGLKFDAPLLRQVALKQFQVPSAPYSACSEDANGAPIISKITTRWIQVFMEKHQIVLRGHTDKRQVSPEKQAQIEREVASHLGQLKRDFESGKLDENAVENIDETHFVIDFDNGKTLGFVGHKQVKYADVVSSGQGMTMVVRISRGASGYIHPPMMIFTNVDRSYPIRGVADDVEGVCYRTGPKGWMDKALFREYLKEPRAIRADSRGREKTVFLDNCSGHLEEAECLQELQQLNARLRYLPANATDLCQPADSFVIAKIKDAWARMWNDKKIELIEGEEWQNKVRKGGSYSGKLKNPGKRFFLELAAAAVKEVNQESDENGINYAGKAMMRCGLSLSVDGTWSIKQLFPHLQEIVKKYPEEFEGVSEDKEKYLSDNTAVSDGALSEEQMVATVVTNDAGTEAML